MKKTLALFLALVLAIGLLAACSSSAANDQTAADLASAQEQIASLQTELDSTKEALTAAQTQASTFDPTKIIDWYNESDLWKTVESGEWSQDPADQITDDQLSAIFSMAAKQQTAVDWTPTYYVVIKDPDAQRDAMVASDAENRDTFVGPGTVTVLILEDQMTSMDQGHASEYKQNSKWYYQSPWPYLNSGMQSSLLGLAAASLGYYTHYYAGVNGPNAVADVADGKYKSMSYYVKDGYVRAMGVGYKDGEEAPAEALYPVKGNCVLVAALVIGKPAKDQPIETWATDYARPENWAIWDNN